MYVFGSTGGSYFRWVTLTTGVYVYQNEYSFATNSARPQLQIPYAAQQEFVALTALFTQYKITEIKITFTPTEVIGSTNLIYRFSTLYAVLYENGIAQDREVNITETETGFPIMHNTINPVTKLYLFRGISALPTWRPVSDTTLTPSIWIQSAESATQAPDGTHAFTIRVEVGVHFRQPKDV